MSLLSERNFNDLIFILQFFGRLGADLEHLRISRKKTTVEDDMRLVLTTVVPQISTYK